MKLAETQNAVIYSMPGTTDFRLLHQLDLGVSEEMPAKGEYFIVHPFAEGPRLYLFAEVHKPVEIADVVIDTGPCLSEAHICNEQEYLRLVERAVGHCRAVQGKVVLSRVQEVFTESIHWQTWLGRLRKAFPRAFVYLLHTAEYGTWMGATPETLVRANGRQFQTDALAGTKWEGGAFTQKEFEEQAVVTGAIIENLHKEDPVVSERTEVNYGNSLRHLLTSITWESGQPIETFAERLHPTPAVCGVPTHAAYNYILRHEPHKRILYTGFLGKVNPKESSHLFVNLRCMQLFRDRIRIFAGGGINAMSDPHAEWEETTRKMNALLQAMNINGGNI